MSTDSQNDVAATSTVTFEEAWERYQQDKFADPDHCDSSVECYRYGVQKFLRWAEESGHTPQTINAWKIGDFNTWLDKNYELEPTTVASYTKAVKQLLKFCCEKGLIDEEVVNGHSVRTASKTERQWNEAISYERVEEIVEYLQNDYPGRRDTVIMTILYRTGMRLSGLRAIDTSDVKIYEDSGAVIELNDREETPLKGGRAHERVINIKQDTLDVISKYISEHRIDPPTENGRNPLIATKFGRISPSAIQSAVYVWTCPHSTGVGTCDCQEKPNTKTARDCDESVSPHAIRGASVTRLRDKGWTFEQISGRVGARPETLEAHYDRSTERMKADQRRALVDEL